MPELYDHILSLEAYTIRLALAVTGMACERRTVAWNPALAIPAPDVVALNPAGTLPVYVDTTGPLVGVPGILRVVALQTDATWWPAATDDVIARWVEVAAGPLATVSQARSARLFGASGDLAALQAAARAALRQIEDHLTDSAIGGADWLAGPQASFADIAVFPPVMLSHDAGVGHEDFPAINLWQRRVRRLPGFIGMPGIPDYF